MSAEQKRLYNVEIALPSGEAIFVRSYGVSQWHAVELAYTANFHEQSDRSKYRVVKGTHRRKKVKKKS